MHRYLSRLIKLKDESTDHCSLNETNRVAVRSTASGATFSDRKRVELNDIFVAGGRPGETEVDRTTGAAFQSLAPLVRRKGRVLSLFGPSKSGKTVLCRQIFRDRFAVEIHSRRAQSVDDFWQSLREALQAPDRTIMCDNRQRESKTDRSGKASVDAGAFGVSANISAHVSVTRKVSDRQAVLWEYGHLSSGQLTGVLAGNEAVLVVDDAHWIPASVQVDILRDLRPFLSASGTVVWLSVPEQAERLLASDHEMSTLCSSIEAPAWTRDELCDIARRGFAALGVTVEPGVIKKLARFCHLNPLLMQTVAFNFCLHHKILASQSPVVSINPTRNDLYEIFRRTARQQARPAYENLVKNKGDKTWRLASGRAVSIYTLCVLGMRHIGFSQEIGVDRLREHIHALTGPNQDTPDSGVVKRALIRLSSDFAAALQHNSPLEYDSSTARVYFLDPFFLIYLQWDLAVELGEAEPEI